MIKRYSVEEIENIWDDHHKYETWLKVEQLVVEAWAKLGVVPTKDLKAIQKLKVNLPRMLVIEEQTKHDVVAFTRMLAEQIGKESRWVHLGITSTDVVDTAQNFLIKSTNEVVEKTIHDLLDTLKKLAVKYQNTLVMGRTHGMYGEPTSLGLKFALWYEEFQRQLVRFQLARQQIEVAKISGSMGNYANLELEIETYVAKKMGLGIDNLSTQVTQRDRHAFLISVFANLASTIEKITTEIRLFQQSEVQEIAEGFSAQQKGSSSMPHKKNPVASENMAGLSRYLRSFVTMTLENNNLWHERDISHSSNERIMFPDVYQLLVYVLKRMNETLLNLQVNETAMKKHIFEAQNIYFSQRVLTYILMNNAKVTREEIYDLIQKCTNEAFVSHEDFKTILMKNNIQKYLKVNELEKLFDNQFFLRQTNQILKRIFK